MPRLGGLELLDPRPLPRACASRQQQRERRRRPAGSQLRRGCAPSARAAGRGGRRPPRPTRGRKRQQARDGHGTSEETTRGGFTRVAPGPAGYNPGGAVPMVERMVEVAPVADEADGAALARRLPRDVAARELRAARGAGVQGEPARPRRPARARGRRRARLRLRGPVPGLPESPRVMVTVPPRNRGRGAGTALYSAISDWARERGLETLEAVVADNDPDSLAFAERRGFVEERREKGVALDLTRDRAAARRAAAGRRDRHLGRPARARARHVRGLARGLAGRARLRGRGARAVRGLARARHARPGRPAGGDLRRGRRRRGRRLREVLALEHRRRRAPTTT